MGWPCPSMRGRCSNTTRVPIGAVQAEVAFRTARSSTSAGRSLIMISGRSNFLAPAGASRTRSARPVPGRDQFTAQRRGLGRRALGMASIRISPGKSTGVVPSAPLHGRVVASVHRTYVAGRDYPHHVRLTCFFGEVIVARCLRPVCRARSSKPDLRAPRRRGPLDALELTRRSMHDRISTSSFITATAA